MGVTNTAAPVFELVVPHKHLLRRVWRDRLEDGSYRDFSGLEARGSIRASYDVDAEVLLDLTPYLEVDGTRIRLTVPGSVTAALDFGPAFWDMVLDDGTDDAPERFLQGPAKLDRGLTP